LESPAAFFSSGHHPYLDASDTHIVASPCQYASPVSFRVLCNHIPIITFFPPRFVADNRGDSEIRLPPCFVSFQQFIDFTEP
jgi:hypothetical protein